MSAKTLNAVQVFAAPAVSSKRLTYSIAPAQTTVSAPEASSHPAELERFLENENPLGCARGVLLIMAFNAIVFVAAFSAWAAFKHFW